MQAAKSACASAAQCSKRMQTHWQPARAMSGLEQMARLAPRLVSVRLRCGRHETLNTKVTMAAALAAHNSKKHLQLNLMCLSLLTSGSGTQPGPHDPRGAPGCGCPAGAAHSTAADIIPPSGWRALTPPHPRPSCRLWLPAAGDCGAGAGASSTHLGCSRSAPACRKLSECHQVRVCCLGFA